ncbi:MAG: hypothetical protein K6T30_00065 [Alicyclobacillus sp.]|nr:hypothetical protein [Alicyclobacillus sp.]
MLRASTQDLVEQAQDQLISLLALRYGLVPDGVQHQIRQLEAPEILNRLIHQMEKDLRQQRLWFIAAPGGDYAARGDHASLHA